MQEIRLGDGLDLGIGRAWAVGVEEAWTANFIIIIIIFGAGKASVKAGAAHSWVVAGLQ